MRRAAAALAIVVVMVLAGPHRATADAVCMDGTPSSADGSGACSGHGGVRRWLPEPQSSPSVGWRVPAGLPWFAGGIVVGGVVVGHVGMLLRRRRSVQLAAVQDIERHAS